jgi:hypothetical protein
MVGLVIESSSFNTFLFVLSLLITNFTNNNTFLIRRWNIEYKEVSLYEEWLDCLLSLRLSRKHKQLFEGICYVLWWHVWSFRNKSIFGRHNSIKADIFDNVVSRSFNWCRYKCNFFFSWIEWLKNPHLIT